MSLHKMLIPAGMRRRLQPHVQRMLEKSGLIRILHRREERRLARLPTNPWDDGRPMPPAELLVLVGGTPDPKFFSDLGKSHFEQLLELAEEHGIAALQPRAVWDLGCGCGRIARWMAPHVTDVGGVFVGSDINPRLVNWCAEHLPGRYFQNRIQPPSGLAPSSMDLVYAYSVLTHLRENAIVGWLREISRVLRPGGLALLTFHDQDYAEAWGPPAAVAALRRESFFVLNDAMEGSNYLSSWMTRDHFCKIAIPDLEICQIIPGQGGERPTQAIAVLRRN